MGEEKRKPAAGAVLNEILTIQYLAKKIDSKNYCVNLKGLVHFQFYLNQSALPILRGC